MVVLVLGCVACVVLPIVAGRSVYRRNARRRRFPPWFDRSWLGIPTPVTTAAVFLVGTAAVLGAGIGLGFAAKALELPVDKPVYRWVYAQVHYVGAAGHSLWTKVNEKFTLTGDNPTVQLVVLFAAVVLGVAYRRRWWLPVVALLGTYLTEKYVQKICASVVDRGSPPLDWEHHATYGTYFSGGVARIITIYGMTLLLIMLRMPSLSRAWRIGLWTGLATTAVAEGYTRVYLSQHWLTDVLGGLVVGTLLLAVCSAAVRLLAGNQGRSDDRRYSEGGVPVTRSAAPR
jgi:undecaprenyl-diphosphatase